MQQFNRVEDGFLLVTQFNRVGVSFCRTIYVERAYYWTFDLAIRGVGHLELSLKLKIVLTLHLDYV